MPSSPPPGITPRLGPRNEPVLDFAPGSRERAELGAELSRQASEIVELPLAPAPIVLDVDEDPRPRPDASRQHQVDEVLECREPFALAADQRAKRLFAATGTHDVEPARRARCDLHTGLELHVGDQLLEDLAARLEHFRRGFRGLEVGSFS